MTMIKSFQLTEKEAFDKLDILFPTGSKAGYYYYLKHVKCRATTLDEEFSLQNSRFMPKERKDRHLHLWANIEFSDFVTLYDMPRHDTLKHLCSHVSSSKPEWYRRIRMNYTFVTL